MVKSAVESDLEAWEKRLPGVRASALAQLAVALAERIDDPDTSATAASNCANSLQNVLEDLRAMLPPEQEQDDVDELSRRRAARRAG